MGRHPKLGILRAAWPRLVVHLPPSMMARVKDQALRERITVARLTRMIVAEWLERRGH